jgi:hypothetical protein
MQTKYKVAMYLSLLLLAVSLQAAPLIENFLQPQPTQQAAPSQQPTAAEMSKKETVSSALLRILDDEEYELRSAAEAMPEEKYVYRPA